MNNKEKYRKSIDNLKADDYLKAKVLKEIREKTKKTPYVKIINVAIAAVFIFSCVIVMSGHDKSADNSIYKNQEIQRISKHIKTVENFEKLKSLLVPKTMDTTFRYNVESALVDDTNAVKKEYSKTNVQVENVDEADIVKTDGEYIYYAGDNKKIKIIDVEKQELVSEIEIYSEEQVGGAQQIYLNDNKLAVISSKYNITKSLICTVGEDNAYSGAIQTTDIYVYNISDKSNIIKENSISLSGNHLTSRMIDDQIYVIANQYVSNRDDSTEDDLLPYYIINGTNKKVPYEDIYYEQEQQNSQYINIMSIKMNGETKLKSFLGRGSNVYVSEKSIYVAESKYKEIIDEEKEIASVSMADVSTQIYKFAINKGNIEIKDTVEVPGRLLNQFAMDEYNGYFRIATTTTKENKTNNNIYVYDVRLNQAGKLTDMAEGENIYAVRFMENKAYVVTFEQVDPLFVIDLSNPKKPKILGELKVPGFSNYLHVYDETHLIGIGQNTVTDNKGNVKTEGIKVSLFDVTNETEPKEISSIVFGESWSYSSALYNHKEILFIKEKGILAFPVTIYKTENNPKYFDGIEVLKISVEDGIKEHGKIGEENSKQFGEKMLRAIYINDKLYSINNKQIIINDIETLQEINRVNI